MLPETKKSEKKSSQNSATVSRNDTSNIHYFTLPPFHLIVVCTVSKPHEIFQSFLMEMLGVIHSFMAGNFNLKLSRSFVAIAI